MAKYIVESYKKTYEKNYMVPFINLVPGFVWSIPIHQKLFPDAGFWVVAGITVAFVMAYVFLSMQPWIAVAPCIAGVIIYTALFWAPADMIGNTVTKYIVKGIILLIAIAIEFMIFGNATIPWLESKMANNPRIRVEK